MKIIQDNQLDHVLNQALSCTEKTPSLLKQDLLVKLKNKREEEEEGRFSVWWLPALVNSLICFLFICFSFVGHIIVSMSQELMNMRWISLLGTKKVFTSILVIIIIQTITCWMFTVISLWKLNLHKKAKLL